MVIVNSQAQGEVRVMKAHLGKKAMDWFQNYMQLDYVTALSRISNTKRKSVQRYKPNC